MTRIPEWLRDDVEAIRLKYRNIPKRWTQCPSTEEPFTWGIADEPRARHLWNKSVYMSVSEASNLN